MPTILNVQKQLIKVGTILVPAHSCLGLKQIGFAMRSLIYLISLKEYHSVQNL